VFEIPEGVDTELARSGIEIDRVRAFSAFVTGETYREMAHEASLLGVPAKATLAVLSMRRKVAELLSRPKIADCMKQALRP
jgi:hypothetical protein